MLGHFGLVDVNSDKKLLHKGQMQWYLFGATAPSAFILSLATVANSLILEYNEKF